MGVQLDADYLITESNTQIHLQIVAHVYFIFPADYWIASRSVCKFQGRVIDIPNIHHAWGSDK